MPHTLTPASKYIFDERPMLVYVELTRCCDLACQHCRAEALLKHDPLELNKEEAFKLLEDIKGFGEPMPHIVLTGGDPLKHPYVFDILQRGTDLGIGMSLSPSATKSLTPAVFARMKKVGVQTISLSLDGATAQSHDAFRGVPGCFDDTMRAAALSHKAGIPFQVNTLVSENTVNELPQIYERLKTLDGLVRWSVFFLISVGRGTALKELKPDKAEHVMQWLVNISKTAPFSVKTTEAPSYRRVVLERAKATHAVVTHKQPWLLQRGFGIRDANGILFISNRGDVYPSGFMPLKAGNIRKTNIVDIYRDSKVFNQVRNPANLEGKCHDCEYRYVCGGSRARAYAATGNPVASDPLCSYNPHREHQKRLQKQQMEIA